MITVQSNIQLRPHFLCTARDFRLEMGKTTRVMGILNMTPDSFSRDGCYTDKDAFKRADALARKHIRNGADILDVGGESTRPGAAPVSCDEELKRILPVTKHLVKEYKLPVSVDTYKTEVARQALDAGASIINNIKGVKAERSLLKMIARYRAAIVLMHIQGNPMTMQNCIHYRDLLGDILSSLGNSIEICLETGIKSDNIIIDPGIGFGKTAENNLEILNRLAEFQVLNCPILVGTSRKSFIGKVLGDANKQRLMGTVASVCLAIANGAHIIRVHDVKQMREAANVADAIINQEILKS